MRQLIAVLVALVLSACSFQVPYHYYYACTNTENRYDYVNETYYQTTRNIPVIYVHKNRLETQNTEFKFTREDDQYWWYDNVDQSLPPIYRRTFRIEKGTNRINNWNCTVEKTLFKK